MTTRFTAPALLVGLALAAPLGAQTTPPPAPVAKGANTTAVPAVSVATPLGATVTGQRGQSAEQIQIDDAQCQNGATQATGYIPGAQTAQAQPAQPQVGGRAKGAAKGAAVGAVAGEVQGNQYARVPDAVQDEYRGNQAGTGAAVGTVAGGMNQRQDRRQSKSEAKKAADAQAQKATAWQNSYAGCLQSRGYSLS
jgi:hypothetical protein